MTPDLDLLTLRLIVAIDDGGSLSAGAAALGLGQPAASARIRAFEARFRLPLLHRSARGSTFTHEGRSVVAWARETLRSVDRMRASLGALAADHRDGVAIAASLTIADYLLPAWLGELQVRRPGLHPTLRVVNSATVVEQVREQVVDLGFIEVDDRPGDLRVRVFGHDRLVAVVAVGHPWATRQDVVSAADLVDERWVLREHGSGTRETFERAVAGEVPVALEASSTAALVGAALSGLGPAVVSERAVADLLEQGRLVRVPIDLDLDRPLAVIWHPDRRLPDAVSDLLERVLAGSGSTTRP